MSWAVPTCLLTLPSLTDLVDHCSLLSRDKERFSDHLPMPMRLLSSSLISARLSKQLSANQLNLVTLHTVILHRLPSCWESPVSPFAWTAKQSIALSLAAMPISISDFPSVQPTLKRSGYVLSVFSLDEVQSVVEED